MAIFDQTKAGSSSYFSTFTSTSMSTIIRTSMIVPSNCDVLNITRRLGWLHRYYRFEFADIFPACFLEPADKY